MAGNIVWKIIITAVVVGWCLLYLIPIQDTPFDVYLQEQVTANHEEFSDVYEAAMDNVAKANEMLEDREALNPAQANWAERNRTLFLALRTMGERGEVDFSKFFPELNVQDIKNIKRRNRVIIDHMLKASKADLQPGLDLRGGVAVTLSIPEESIGTDDFEREQNLGKAIDVMRSRVDGMGVAEPLIREAGERSIELQMPGIDTKDNPQLITEISKPAKLEFRMVKSVNSQGAKTPMPVPADLPAGATEVMPINANDPNSPVATYEVMEMEREDHRTGQIDIIRYFVKKRPEATGEIISRAGVTADQMGQFIVTMNFVDDTFGRITGNNIGEFLAIVLDGELYSAPRINGRITDSGIIEGSFSQREAFQLANVLNNPLAVPLETEQLYEVGPTLARDAREASINAGLIGGALVITFMIVYYGVSGIIAMLSVALNIIIVLGVLGSVGATITLPGVAALVLTVGMAVDAQILIFERMREELNVGKNIKNALQAGYDKALSTIVDANVTTLITAVILYVLGTTSVKGFGLTLGIGIVASMFCALVVTRWMLELVIFSGLAKKVLLLSLFREMKLPFMNYRRAAFAVSWVIVLLGAIVVGMKNTDVLGIDFLGGNQVTLNYGERLDVQEIEQVAADMGLGEVQPVYQREFGTGEEFLRIQTESGSVTSDAGLEVSRGQALLDALQARYPTAELTYVGEQQIGAAVSSDIATNAILSVGTALLCILLYVAVRFEFGFGIGAVVATIHDVAMTIGLFVILGNFLGLGSGLFTAPMVAAILMIVGYSLNDTIVVFDRIREELELNPEMKLFDVINMAIGRTLSRTILTSITTLLAAFSLFIFGAGVVVDYALVFLIGILTGTFSSIFIASPVFFWWHKGDRKHVEERELLPKYDWESSTRAAKTTENA